VYAHTIHNPNGVRFVGPLAPLAGALKGEFARLGYTTSSATAQLQLAAHVSRWLQAEGLGSDALTGPVIERFLGTRRRDYSSHYSMRALVPLLGYLRQAGLAPEPVVLEPRSGGERVLARFGEYLRAERGLTEPVVLAYQHWVRPFVEQVVDVEESDLRDLGAVDVQQFWSRLFRACHVSRRR
jgi:integrase/recombinase XerD